jgi:hypothetical protein
MSAVGTWFRRVFQTITGIDNKRAVEMAKRSMDESREHIDFVVLRMFALDEPSAASMISTM